MPASRPRSMPWSVRKRIRVLTTFACMLTALGGLLAGAAGHLPHGALLLLGSVLLLPGSVWGRRHRHHVSAASVASVTSNASAKARVTLRA